MPIRYPSFFQTIDSNNLALVGGWTWRRWNKSVWPWNASTWSSPLESRCEYTKTLSTRRVHSEYSARWEIRLLMSQGCRTSRTCNTHFADNSLNSVTKPSLLVSRSRSEPAQANEYSSAARRCEIFIRYNIKGVACQAIEAPIYYQVDRSMTSVCQVIAFPSTARNGCMMGMPKNNGHACRRKSYCRHFGLPQSV